MSPCPAQRQPLQTFVHDPLVVQQRSLAVPNEQPAVVAPHRPPDGISLQLVCLTQLLETDVQVSDLQTRSVHVQVCEPSAAQPLFDEFMHAPQLEYVWVPHVLFSVTRLHACVSA